MLKKPMMCPILNIGRTDQTQRCQMWECEFWMIPNDKCAIPQIAKALILMEANLNVEVKMHGNSKI